MSPEPLLRIRDLRIEFADDDGWQRVVDGAHLDVRPGGARALVGESGSGKTVTALAVMGLLPRRHSRIPTGRIELAGQNLLDLTERQLRPIRGTELAMIFQEPMTSLNPAYTVGEQIAETVRVHTGASRKDAWRRAVEVLGEVGIPAAARRAAEYPHTFSGGMRQRVMIAMAISCRPKLLIADEPTTALDVTVQAAILALLRELQETTSMAVLLVTHDLGVVADFCDDVTVMYAGQPVEEADTVELFASPRHPYTSGLLRAMPQSAHPGLDLSSIPGVVPRADRMPPGCRFHPRCSHAQEGLCDIVEPDLLPLDGTRASRCLRIQRGELDELSRIVDDRVVAARADLDRRSS
ncbi:ABC transporter ATP-binding protein [Pseudonocardia sulfidoxydans NBRC 16205]|uniref:ABC transporter ATP-binding protein n=1 Tax=Pseudonocardia sulfidoxydans NBRC 16205 TaxID=1223511 RepID=A0A511D8T2_9PSEU|nr:ABC transporter ATP-binding protein [Pseudonocardia sulfidoxydans]GEL21210.1 ABC transporter ATP-binding protein [Pseudonocardia sulfidoxydans NBRC 16205]